MSRRALARPFTVSIMAVMMTAAASAADRYEAEDAVMSGGGSDAPAVAAHNSASGGQYVQMKEGALTFTFNVPGAGFYTILAGYSQTCDDTKNQNYTINGTETGKMGFAKTGPYESSSVCGPAVFAEAKVVGKVRLNSGANTLEITKEWGWVDIDYLEVVPFAPEPFDLSSSLVTPNASANASKVYGFLRDNFQKKIISGVMTDRTAQDNGQYTPHTHQSQPESKHVFEASGKYPALLGLDFMHSSGQKSEEQWYMGYTNGALGLAESFFNAGGIPIFCWHWKDPLKKTESSAFYSENTDFELAKAFTNNTYTTFNTSSPEYIAMIADIDLISGYLKQLADNGVPVLWRPLHEAAGGWFWWGRDKRAAPCKALWRLMFDRMVNHHGLNNLIWVWTCEEGGDALDWYPGDDYVDIVGRDYYPYPNQREQVHGSLVAHFENLKEIYGGRKIITLSENGAVPHPDSLVNDGAQWSWFMSWYGDFTTSVNTAGGWNYLMNHDYVISLDEMPGWDNYASVKPGSGNGMAKTARSVTVSSRRGVLELNIKGLAAQTVELFNLRGSRIAVLNKSALGSGTHRLPVKNAAKQMCVIKITSVEKKVITMPVRIE